MFDNARLRVQLQALAPKEPVAIPDIDEPSLRRYLKDMAYLGLIGRPGLSMPLS